MIKSIAHSVQTQSARLITVYLIACSVAVALVAVLQPEFNWDVIGYVASALNYTGVSGQTLHQLTYADVEAAVVNPVLYDALITGKDYRVGVASDPVALEQQLPFYQTRVLYLGLTLGVAMLVPTLAFATVIVSATAAGLSIWGLHRLFALRAWWAALLLPTAAYFGGIDVVAAKSSPDALAVACVVAALLVASRRPAWGLLLFALLPLLRTDYVILVFLSPIVFWGRVKWFQIVATLIAAYAVYWSLNTAFGNYGYRTIFNFTLIQGPQPYPLEMNLSQDMSDYLSAYLRGLQRFVDSGNLPILVVATGLGLYHVIKGAEFLDRVMVLLAVFGLAHFVLFPVGFERFYVLTMIFCYGYLVLHFDRLAARRSGVDGSV